MFSQAELTWNDPSLISLITERTPPLSNSLHTIILCLHIWFLYCTKFTCNFVIVIVCISSLLTNCK